MFMKRLIPILFAALLIHACGSPAHNKYARAMEEIVLANAPGNDKSAYKFTILEMTELADITLDSLTRLRPHLALPDEAPRTIKVMRTHYQTTDPKSGSIFKEKFDFYLAPDGSTCYLKIKTRD